MTTPPPVKPAGFTSKHLIGFIVGVGVLALLAVGQYYSIRIPPQITPAESSYSQSN